MIQHSYLDLTPTLAVFCLCYFTTGKAADYWSGPDYESELFDPDQDCEREEEMKRLLAMQPIRCEERKIINAFDRNIKDGKQKAFSECKILLTIRLEKQCDFSRKKAIS